MNRITLMSRILILPLNKSMHFQVEKLSVLRVVLFKISIR